MVSKLSWVLSILALILIAVQAAGYNVIVLLSGVVIIDLVAIKYSVGKHGNHEVFGAFEKKLSTIETHVLDMVSFIKTKETQNVTLGGIEESLEKHKDSVRAEVKDHLDRVAEKAIDIENRLSDMKKGFSAAIAAFDDRLRALEGAAEPEPAVEETEEYVEVHPQVQQ
ncbi:MAG: hypothetical protein HY362_01965 [Candidatus Aenigmarchaeota archaeon]|nr:hypothetical protein [Candidatus Aenigmarchaeota archaeon]